MTMSTKKMAAGLRSGLPATMVLASLLAVAPGISQAAQTSTTMGVSIIINTGCAVSASALNFGTASTLTSPIDATTTVSTTCTDSAPYKIGLDAGSGASATVANRLMTGPSAATVAYTLYQDSARTTVWGNTEGTDTVAGTGTGNAQSFTVYGRVFGPQSSPAPGGYADTVNVYVYY
jgi:spore coat protein U-like protein